MRNFGLDLLLLCGLIVATPIIDPPQNVDINNPSASDPRTTPKRISFPKRPDNPFPNGIPIQPDKCDGEFPSDECFHTIGSRGGYLYYEKGPECSDNQKSVLETALWEATTLASYSSNFPNNGEGSRGSASAHFYMGPDYLAQKNRIASNLQRVSEFKSGKTSEKAYITMSCKDTQNLCNQKGQGTVGGYAWTYNGWFGYYHYITFCPPFFSLDNMDQKIAEIESELSGGKAEKASDMRYLRTTGQYFLHEMMHTRIADGGKEPHITDEGVVEPGKTYPGNPAAYGPNLVHKLAQRPINQNGGTTRSSTNADSYAILANCAWWWDTTGYFPGVPEKYGSSSVEDDFPISLWIDLGNTTSPSNTNFASLFSVDVQGFESSTTTTLTTQTTTASTGTATAGDSCKESCTFSPIPLCVAVASSREISAYCNCDGTLAPTLNPTASGFLNCAYTVLPTSSYNPGRTPPSATPEPSYASGKCNVHLVQALGQQFSDPEVVLGVNITDANGTSIGSNKGPVGWGDTLNTDSLLPWVLLVAPQNGIGNERRSSGKFLRKRVGGPVHPNRPLYEKGPVDFAYASQIWDTPSSQCSVGGWDNGNAKDFFGSLILGEDFFPNRQIDCLFDCPAPDSSEKRDVVKHHDEEWKQDLNSPSRNKPNAAVRLANVSP